MQCQHKDGLDNKIDSIFLHCFINTAPALHTATACAWRFLWLGFYRKFNILQFSKIISALHTATACAWRFLFSALHTATAALHTATACAWRFLCYSSVKLFLHFSKIISALENLILLKYTKSKTILIIFQKYTDVFCTAYCYCRTAYCYCLCLLKCWDRFEYIKCRNMLTAAWTCCWARYCSYRTLLMTITFFCTFLK